MVLKKYRRQLSDKAVTVDYGGQPFFIPNTFEHNHIDNDFVNIEFPQWFLDKHKQILHEMEVNTNLLIKRLQ